MWCVDSAKLVDSACICAFPARQYGAHCEHARCDNDGTSYGDGTCACSKWHNGLFCEHIVCLNGGHLNALKVCECPQGNNITGKHCEFNPNGPLSGMDHNGTLTEQCNDPFGISCEAPTPALWAIIGSISGVVVLVVVSAIIIHMRQHSLKCFGKKEHRFEYLDESTVATTSRTISNESDDSTKSGNTKAKLIHINSEALIADVAEEVPPVYLNEEMPPPYNWLVKYADIL